MYLNQRSQCIKTTEKNMIQRDLMTMKKSNYSNRNLKEVKRVLMIYHRNQSTKWK